MNFLDFEEVLAIHDRMLEVGGGGQGIRDFTLLHSAMERSKASFGGRDLYPTIFLKAAALMHSLVNNHAFADANKRTAFGCTVRFLQDNGFEFHARKREIIQLTMDVEAKKLNLDEIASWLKKHTRNVPSYPIRHYSTKELNGFLKLDAKEARRLRKKTRSLPKITH